LRLCGIEAWLEAEAQSSVLAEIIHHDHATSFVPSGESLSMIRTTRFRVRP
jgi:hypothetical protein